MIGFMRVMQFSFALIEQAHADVLALCRGADLVVVPHSAVGSIEAEQLGLPAVSVMLMPQAIPVDDPSRPLLARAAGRAIGALMGLFMTRPLNQIRKRLGLGPMGPMGITSARLNLIPVDPAVIAPDPRWETRHRMTGYWFAETPRSWEPPRPLLAFLQAGEPPIVISLGAMSAGGPDADEACRMTIEAVRQAGVRAVVQGWRESLPKVRLPESVFPLGPAPHTWLLDQAMALMHHGGFGTTSAGLRAGIPSLVIPHIIDQFIWGQRIHELGAGPKAIPRNKLNVDDLAASFQLMRDDPAMRDRASALGETIRARDGIGEALRLIEAAVLS
jgi:UDP:flavonoid glycosyltransferase YjiC (YdhE family)